MLFNTCAQLVPLIKEKKPNINIKALLDFFKYYKQNDWIYPGVLHRKLNISIKDVYDILEVFADQNIVERYLQIYCPECSRYTGDYYKTISEIPDEVCCPHCDQEIEKPLQHTIIVYKVI